MISLKELCLDLIAEEFEKFHLAFKDSKDETLKRLFDFLLRKYSSEVLSELFYKRKLREEYLDYLMNEHLKCLSLDFFTGTHYENAMEDILCRVPNATEITCFACKDETLENVAKYCPKIVEIGACISSVTDVGIKYLCNNENGKIPCPELKRLLIGLDEVSDEGLKRLIQHLSSLEILYPEKMPWILYSIHKGDLPGFKNIQSYNLVELNMQNFSELPYYSDLLKVCLNVCPRLKDLRCSISDKEQLTFFENKRLEKLFIEFCETESKINVNNFLKNCGATFTTLNIQNCIMSISALVVSCPILEDLRLNDVTFLEDDSELVLQSLITCNFTKFKNVNSSNKAMHSLLSSPKLQAIRIVYCSLSPDTKSYILKCCENNHLKSIHFLGTVVEMNFVKDVLLSCSSLVSLAVGDSHFQNSEIKELKEIAATLPNKPSLGFY